MSVVTAEHACTAVDALEHALEPGVPVIDAHHHLYDRPGTRYLLDDFLQDVTCGHDVRATVLVQARAMLRVDGPRSLQHVGETEFANGIAAMSASGIYGDTRVCAGIVGYADLLLGDAVAPVLDAHLQAGGGLAATGGRFCGVRQGLAWDKDQSLLNPAYATTEDMSEHPEFRKGFCQLAKRALSFDAWLFFHQIPRLTALARAFPSVPIVLNHCGGVLGVGAYAGLREQVFNTWRTNLRDLADCPNVMIKLSGLGMKLSGFTFNDRSQSPRSSLLAHAWRPWIDTCIDVFGPSRCMFGSNFPVDKGNYSYGVGLNALKSLTSGASVDEKDDIFWRTAARFYRLPTLGRIPDHGDRPTGGNHGCS